jgi:hypothetical protein
MILRISTAQSDLVPRNSILIRPRLNVLINTMKRSPTLIRRQFIGLFFPDGSCGGIRRSRFGSAAELADYCGLILAARITLPHFSVSSSKSRCGPLMTA